MTPRHVLLVLLLLPFVVARSVLPSGFMWASSADAGHIVFCPDQSSLALASQLAGAEQIHPHHHAGMQHGGSHTGHGSHAHSGSQCPFAVAAMAVPPAFTTGIVSIAIVSAEPALTVSLLSHGIDASRAHPIRGPPALS